MCEMCGADVELYKAEIEGSKLNVCMNCAKFGKIINPVKQPVKVKPKPARKFEPAVEKKNLIFIVSSDFAEKIRKKREMLGLKQEDFAKKISERESIVHKLETGEFTPSLKLARKLEVKLGIKLIESYEEEESVTVKGESEPLTIGDMIKIKKK